MKRADADTGYRSFRLYLESIFMYAGSWSLSQELNPVKNSALVELGDVFIPGGFPGRRYLLTLAVVACQCLGYSQGT